MLIAGAQHQPVGVLQVEGIIGIDREIIDAGWDDSVLDR